MALVWKFLFYFGVMTLPFYPFNSGGIQPSHAVLALAFAVLLVNASFRLQVNLFGKIYLLMVVYIMLREITAAMGNSNVLSLLSPIYFLFNLMVLMLTHNLSVRESKLNLAVMVSGLVAMLGVIIIGVSFVRGDMTMRAIGTFNNPNQLGYFSVCFLSLSYLFYACKMISGKVFVGLMCIGFFCGFVSLSKSAILSNIVVLLAFLLSISFKNKVLILTSMIFLFMVVFVNDLVPIELIQSSELYYRFDRFGQESDSSLASRGYLLIFESGILHLIFGMGKEGVKAYFGLETHSSIMSMLNSYGLVGLIFFLVLLAVWFLEIYRAFGFEGFMGICLPAVLYGLAHNGNRFVIFWLLVGASLSIARTTFQARAERLNPDVSPDQTLQNPVNKVV